MFQIEGYSAYEIDEHGCIFSKERYVPNARTGVQKVPCRKLKPIKHMTGYYVLRLKKDGDLKAKTIRYHILVARTFIPNPENKPYVNHINGNKLDFHPSNLEWVTAKENVAHARQTGLTPDSGGVNNPACRFTLNDVEVWLKEIKEGAKISDLNKKYKCSGATVAKLINFHFPNQLPKYNGNYKTRFKGGNNE